MGENVTPCQMRILHLSDSELSGGAALAAYRLHTAMGRAGLVSRMLVRNKWSADETVHPVYFDPWLWRRLRLKRALFPRSFARPESKHLFHFDVVDDLTLDAPSEFPPDAFDVIYLHHVARFLSTRHIRHLTLFYGCPVVQVLHTHAPFTGGCNFTLGCERFTEACGRCPQLSEPAEDDASRAIWQRKHDLLSELPISFVAPSEEAARLARRSSLVDGRRVEVIPNPIDGRVFDVGDRLLARRRFGIPEHASVILASAIGFDNYYKGTDYLLQALAELSIHADPDTRKSLFVLVAGEDGEELLRSQPFPGKAVGRLNHGEEIASAYRAADVFVCSSRVETGPQTVPEALLCGTPVVSFRVGSTPDLVRDGATGYLAAAGSGEGLAQGVEEVAPMASLARARRSMPRRRAVAHVRARRREACPPLGCVGRETAIGEGGLSQRGRRALISIPFPP